MLKRIAVGAFVALAVAASARAETQSRRPLFNGYIGLQSHGKDDVVFFKEVAVRPLGE